jgi:hypothetical protein
MKNQLFEKFKDALISNEEAKTIFGGYDLGTPYGNPGCGYPICERTFSSAPKPACEQRTNVRYWWGNAYGRTEVIHCLTFA